MEDEVGKTSRIHS